MTKVNPIVTLKAQAEKFDFSKLRAAEDNVEINSGRIAYIDISRMDFVINEKDIDHDFVNKLYKKHASLIENDKDGEGNYRLFMKEIFREIFKYAGAEVPSNQILEELINSCNQAGYEFVYVPFVAELLCKHKLLMNVNGDRRVYIDCRSPNSVEVKCEVPKIDITTGHSKEKICDISFSLEFTLESKGVKDGVTYRDGKLSLDIPEELKNYQDGDKSLFDIIKGYFQKFCEILGFTFETKIEHNLGDPLKVNSHLKSVELPVHSHSNNHVYDN